MRWKLQQKDRPKNQNRALMETFMKTFVLLLQLFCIPCFVSAQFLMPASSQVELGKWWKNSSFVKELQLTENQIEKIEQSFLSHRTALSQINESLKAQEAQLKILMGADNPDRSAIINQTDRVAAARAALGKESALLMLAIKEHLTQEQWKKLSEIEDGKVINSRAAMTSPTAGPQGEKIYVAGGPVNTPKIVRQPMPSYTQPARDARVEGIVLLQIIVRKDGTVGNAKIIRGLGYGLDESAIEKITREWLFIPGTIDDVPVDVLANIEVSFRLY
jgi:TonB family protein